MGKSKYTVVVCYHQDFAIKRQKLYMKISLRFTLLNEIINLYFRDLLHPFMNSFHIKLTGIERFSFQILCGLSMTYY